MASNLGEEDHLYDSIQWIIYHAILRHRELPEPIPWVEPSINMPYLEACESYVFGCGWACTITLGALLEHLIRLAVIDIELGYPFSMSEELWNKYNRFTIAQFHKQGHLEKVVDKEDLDWWVKFAGERVRNKTAHLDIPLMIRDLGRLEKYVGNYRDTDERWLIFSGRYWWGAPFHRSDQLVALGFLHESSEKMRCIIRKMKWPEFRQHWISQKWRYDSFFQKQRVWQSLKKCYEANPLQNVIDSTIVTPPNDLAE